MKLDKKTMLRIFLIAAACIVLFWVLSEMDKVAVLFGGISKIFSPFVAGAIIAFILNVPMRAYEKALRGIKRHALRRILAICLTIVSVLIVLTLVCVLLIPQLAIAIIQLVTTMSDLPNWLVETGKNFLARYPQLYDWATANVDITSVNWGSLAQNVVPQLSDYVSSILTYLFSMIGSFANGLVDTFMAIVFSIYCLFNKDLLARQGRKLLYAFIPEKFADRVVYVLRLSNVTFSNFLSGQCVEACILGCLFALCMTIFGMPYAALISVLIAVTAFIPIVGALIGCAVGAFLIGVTDPILAIYFVIMSVVLQQLENNLIYPRVVGTSIGLPGMWVLVAVSVGGAVMGVGGMFLMIPLSSVLYVLIRMITNKRLSNMNIDEEKLKCQPIDFKENQPLKKKKRKKKNEEQQMGSVENNED